MGARIATVSVCALAAIAAAATGALAGDGPASGGPGSAIAAGWAASAVRTGYVAPVAGRVVVLRPFERPPGPYAAGHRGVDLAVGRDVAVRAARAGRVRFAGSVAGRGVVVIDHADGVRTEYEPVAAAVAPGALVVRGQRIGAVSGRHGRFPADGCLHWGAERGGQYFDPMALLAPLGVVRLIPWSTVR